MSAAFEEAATKVKKLKAEPSQNTKLELYGLFKQVTSGDLDPAKEPKPGFYNFEASAKWTARQKLIGKSKEDAEKEYIALVEKLIAEIGLQE